LNNGFCEPEGLSACPRVGRTELICRIFRVRRQEGPDGFLSFLRFQAEAFCVVGAFRMSNCGVNGTPNSLRSPHTVFSRAIRVFIRAARTR
jgi:hypothetical protein